MGTAGGERCVSISMAVEVVVVCFIKAQYYRVLLYCLYTSGTGSW